MPEKIELNIEPASIALLPGEVAEFAASVRNLGQTVDQVLLSIDGLDPSWYTVPVSSVALFPNDHDTLKINVHPPITAESQVGSHSFRITVTSQEDPGSTATVEASLEIRALLEVEMEIMPQSWTGRKGNYQLVLNNPGSSDITLNLTAADPADRLRYQFNLTRITIGPESRAGANLEVRLGWLSYLGGERAFDFYVAAIAPDAKSGGDFCPYCGQKTKQDAARPRVICPNCQRPIVEGAKIAHAELVRPALIKGFPSIRIPWFTRKPVIESFVATTEDKRTFKLRWNVKHAREVLLDGEPVGSSGERTVTPTKSTTYTLAATNKDRSTSSSLEVHPLPFPEQASERIRASLTPTELQVHAGQAPIVATLQLQNLGEIVDKFFVEIEGLDPSWYNRSASSVALMPQATDQVQITFQPPKNEGVRDGKYPFAIVVRSESVAEDVTSVLAQLEIMPAPEFKLQVRPARVTARRKGTFRIGLVNTGVTDITFDLEATDLEEGCKFQFKDEHPSVTAWHSVEVPMITKPKRGWFVGERKVYNISVTAKGNNIPQTGNCDLTHKALFSSWRSFLRFVRAIVVITVLIVGILLAIHWGGGFSALIDDPGQWAQDLVDGTYAPW